MNRDPDPPTDERATATSLRFHLARPVRWPVRWAVRWAARAVAACALLVGLYFGAAELGMRIAVEATPDPGAREVDVYLVSNGVHVDVWVPAVRSERDWTRWLPAEPLLRRNGYVAFGWGDRRFFLEVPTWDDLTAGVAIQGALWPTPSAVHVTAYSGRPRAGDRVHRLRITRAQYASLVEYIDRAFELDDEGRPVLLDHPGYRERDRFFAGRSKYHLFRTCNVWSNGAVRATGQRAALWAPFERNARFHLPRNRGEDGPEDAPPDSGE